MKSRPWIKAAAVFLIAVSVARGDQTVAIDASGPARKFDGIGAVSGGGGTSVLLKDYPEKQRAQILDLLFKPNFGASISALYVEIGGDGNSTQGSELSHEHFKGDANFRRGYEWWLMREAKARNPDLSLDACGWSCPGWIGNGNFYSQDMCDYYADWALGLKSTYGLTLDAIGCRNESGVHEDFAKMLRATLDAKGLNHVLIHGFDNWTRDKWDWTKDLEKDEALRHAIGVLGNHVLGNVVEHDGDTPASVRELSPKLDKPIWDTEEHVYKEGYDCEISLVKSFNLNFIDAGATKVVNWYLEDSLYRLEGYKTNPAMLIADSPWSGHYQVRAALWAYAHYGQFTKIGWNYLSNACGHFDGGGSFVTLTSPANDYSVIAETSGAKQNQTVTFKLSGVATGNLCVWRSNAHEQFMRQADIAPAHGSFAVILEPESIYSISTTTGQQKGSFDDIPTEAPFPFPYHETFSSYNNAGTWGYLPHYTADIAGAFELADRPDHKGACLRQVLDRRAQNWGHEWMPTTILGDAKWTDYEVSCDVLLDGATGSAGIMGRLHAIDGQSNPRGYLFTLGADKTWSLGTTAVTDKDHPIGTVLATGAAPTTNITDGHNLKLRFSGVTITASLDGAEVGQITNTDFPGGMIALVTSDGGKTRTTACFGNLIIKAVDAPDPAPTDFGRDREPLYRASP